MGKKTLSLKADKRAVYDSLLAQLALKKADTPYFIDRVQEYMRLWDIADKMAADIEERGITVMAMSAAGNEYEKTNDFVKLLPGYVKQMQSMLDSMGLKTDAVITDADTDAEGL